MRVLETARLRLREMADDDAPFVLEVLTDPDFVANVGDRGVHELASARRYILEGPGASYVKYGFPQIMGPDDLQFWQSKDEVPVLTKAGTTDRGIVYVQSSGTLCEFQPYRLVTPEPPAKKTKKKG